MMILFILGFACKLTVSSAADDGCIFTENGTYINGNNYLLKMPYQTITFLNLEMVFIYRICIAIHREIYFTEKTH